MESAAQQTKPYMLDKELFLAVQLGCKFRLLIQSFLEYCHLLHDRVPQIIHSRFVPAQRDATGAVQHGKVIISQRTVPAVKDQPHMVIIDDLSRASGLSV